MNGKRGQLFKQLYLMNARLGKPKIVKVQIFAISLSMSCNVFYYNLIKLMVSAPPPPPF